MTRSGCAEVCRKNPEWRWNLMDFIIVFASLLENAIELSSLVSNDGDGIALTGMSGVVCRALTSVLQLCWGVRSAPHFPFFR